MVAESDEPVFKSVKIYLDAQLENFRKMEAETATSIAVAEELLANPPKDAEATPGAK
jgi:hypothetical protein